MVIKYDIKVNACQILDIGMQQQFKSSLKKDLQLKKKLNHVPANIGI